MSDFNPFYDDLDALYGSYDAGDSTSDVSDSLVSNFKKKEKKKKKEEKFSFLPNSINPNNTNWGNILSSLSTKQRSFDFDPDSLEEDRSKKKKEKTKKRSQKSEEEDFSKLFQKELVLLDELYKDQEAFTNTLNQMFRGMTSSKSTVRGTTKGLTDLIETINQARNSTLSILDKKISTKRTISELKLKQRAQELKEGGVNGADVDEEEDFSKLFQKELVLLDELYKDQEAFTNTLNQMFRGMTSSKSTVRGTTKGLTDLIETINQARNSTLSILDKKISTKRTISELKLKQRAQELKEGGVNGADVDNAKIASDYLSKLIANGRSQINQFGVVESSDSNIASMVYDSKQNTMEDAISESIGDLITDTSYLEFIDKSISVCVTKNEDGSHNFVAIDSDTNEICEGYPLPNPEIDITYDESGKHATDLYGRKYDVIDLSERRKANEERFNAS